MVSLRCPKCSTTVEGTPGAPVQCPNCGFFAAAPLASAPPTAAPAVPTPFYSAASGSPAVYVPVAPAPYVMPQAASGKPRAFWLSLLLGLVTLGVYFFVWNYVTFRELDREHNEKHASGWFWTALSVQIAAVLVLLVGSFAAEAVAAERGATASQAPAELDASFLYVALGLQFVSTAIFLGYLFREISRVEAYRQRRGLPDGFAPVWFVILFVLGPLMAGLTVVAAYFFLSRSVNGLWNQIYSEKGLPVRTS